MHGFAVCWLRVHFGGGADADGLMMVGRVSVSGVVWPHQERSFDFAQYRLRLAGY